MTSTLQPTEPRQLPPDAVYKVINPTFKFLLHTPLHGLMSKHLMVLTFKGRKSGKTYSIPVAYVQQGNTLFTGTQSRWASNLRGGVPVNLRLRGEKRSGTADVISDEQGLREQFGIILPQSPQLGEIMGIKLEPNGEPRAVDLAAARARGTVIVRIELAE